MKISTTPAPHKINNAIGQALIAQSMGKRRIIAETGQGQHRGGYGYGVCALMGMECVVYMGRVDVERQYANVKKMEMLGAEVVAVESGGAAQDAVDAAVGAWCSDPSGELLSVRLGGGAAPLSRHGGPSAIGYKRGDRKTAAGT